MLLRLALLLLTFDPLLISYVPIDTNRKLTFNVKKTIIKLTFIVKKAIIKLTFIVKKSNHKTNFYCKKSNHKTKYFVSMEGRHRGDVGGSVHRSEVYGRRLYLVNPAYLREYLH